MDRAVSRMTKQREAIHTVLEEARRPLSLDEILEMARQHYPKLGERTVFRNLKEMIEQLQVIRLNFPGQPHRFEIATGKHHPHVVCRDCQKVFDLEKETPDILAQYKSPPEFKLEGEEVLFYGRCRITDCAHKKDTRSA